MADGWLNRNATRMDLRWLITAMAARGITQAELARRMPMEPIKLNKSIKGKRALTLDEAILAANVLNVPVPTESQSDRNNLSDANSEGDDYEKFPLSPMVEDVPTYPLDLPVMGVARTGEVSGMYEVLDEVVDWVRRPPRLSAAKRAYCVEVLTNVMARRFNPRDLAIINPAEEGVEGDVVAVEFNPETGKTRGRFIIREIVTVTADQIVVLQYWPENTTTLQRSDIKSTARVYHWGEVMRS